jgi:hypothetical protein
MEAFEVLRFLNPQINYQRKSFEIGKKIRC